ncbi:MAG: energy-coupling factor transporter transmembrane protein EcfT [Bryobacterales bacterium]|nr:energy-coupling factor transporter transmembrane protein EcfT [Bryobacterales bacterium]
MHYLVLERWSRGDSSFHRLDARVKIAALLLYLVAIATTHPFRWSAFAAFALLVLSGVIAARLPLGGMLLRAAAVLPFTATFAAISALAGDTDAAFRLLARSYASALGVLLLAASTTMPALLHAASSLGFPRILVLVLQFLYRYLFVVTDQAQRMRSAALCRGSALRRGAKRERFRAASGVLAVLFARSYEKAQGIERAMLARGFDGRIHLLSSPRLAWRDAAFLGLAASATLGLRFLLTISA